MSRVGKLPVKLPDGISVDWKPPVLKVKGPKGELSQTINQPASIKVEDGVLQVTRPDDTRKSKSYQGLYRSLVSNMVMGVSQGFERKLEIVGVGYRAEVSGDLLKLHVGFAFPKEFKVPEGINVQVEKEVISVQGIDKQQVGDVAARIRAHRPPEPYKGKGIRYQGEMVRRKAGKAAAGGK